MRKEMLSFVLLWVRRGIALAMLGTITWLSLTDTSGFRQHEMTHWLVGVQRMTGAELDKIVHFLMYAALTGSVWLSLPWRVRRVPSPLVAFAAATAWGVLMEFAQGLGAWLGWGRRSFDVADMAANTLGALAATLPLLLLWVCLNLWHRGKTRA